MLAYNPAGTPQYVAQTANKQSQGLFHGSEYSFEA